MLYYLLGIPVMWLIPSKVMDFSLYFVANFITTTFVVFVYNRIANFLIVLKER